MRDSVFQVPAAAAAPLSEYAWRYRYPDVEDGPPVWEAEDALVLARQVFEAVTQLLSTD